MLCPNCGQDNIPGTDLCESCGSDLAGLDLPEAHHGFRGQMLTDRVGEPEMAKSLYVAPETKVAAAVVRMRQERHGCVLVRQDSELVGIFTERDLLTRVLLPGLDMKATSLGEVMSPDPVTLSPNDPLAFAIYNTVARGLRHLPVVQDNELLGFISVRDLLRYIHRDVIQRHKKS